MSNAVKDHETCANWLNYEAIRLTVKEYNAKWGAPDEPPFSIDEFQMTKNCMECNMRPNLSPPLETAAQIASLFKDTVLVQLEKVGMKRKCFKPVTVEEIPKEPTNA